MYLYNKIIDKWLKNIGTGLRCIQHSFHIFVSWSIASKVLHVDINEFIGLHDNYILVICKSLQLRGLFSSWVNDLKILDLMLSTSSFSWTTFELVISLKVRSKQDFPSYSIFDTRNHYEKEFTKYHEKLLRNSIRNVLWAVEGWCSS